MKGLKIGLSLSPERERNKNIMELSNNQFKVVPFTPKVMNGSIELKKQTN